MNGSKKLDPVLGILKEKGYLDRRRGWRGIRWASWALLGTAAFMLSTQVALICHSKPFWSLATTAFLQCLALVAAIRFLTTRLLVHLNRIGVVSALTAGRVAGLLASTTLVLTLVLLEWTVAWSPSAVVAASVGATALGFSAGLAVWSRTAPSSRSPRLASLLIHCLLPALVLLTGTPFKSHLTSSSNNSEAGFSVPSSSPTGCVAVLGVDELEAGDALFEAPWLSRWRRVPLSVDLGRWGRAATWLGLAMGTRNPPGGDQESVLLGIGKGVARSCQMVRLLMAPAKWMGLARFASLPAEQRSSPTAWELASKGGRTVLVAGWWGSYPPRRVLGVVASERWLFTGNVGQDTVFPASALEPGPKGHSPTLVDERAIDLLRQWNGEDLVMAYFPGMGLLKRQGLGPIEAGHMLGFMASRILKEAKRLSDSGCSVWIISLTESGSWVASSGVGAKDQDGVKPISMADLAPTWLDQLGLPVPTHMPDPRRDLSGVSQSVPVVRACYGGPPPLAGTAPPDQGELQLELIRSLGYLR